MEDPIKRSVVPGLGTIDETAVLEVTLTRYVCSYEGLPAGLQAGYCGRTANGEQVQNGVAACGSAFGFGTRFVVVSDPSGRVFHCADRGYLGNYQVDLWFFDWAEAEAWREQCHDCWPWQIIVP